MILLLGNSRQLNYSRFYRCCYKVRNIYLHGFGVVHRDLHPKNILLNCVDERKIHLVFADLGCSLHFGTHQKGGKREEINFSVTVRDLVDTNEISRIVTVSGETTAVSCGTSNFLYGGCREYLAPEVMEVFNRHNKSENWLDEFVDYGKNDIFSIGVLMLFLVCSFHEEKQGSGGTNDEKMARIKLKDDLDLLEKFQPELSRVVSKLIEKDPRKRIGMKMLFLKPEKC